MIKLLKSLLNLVTGLFTFLLLDSKIVLLLKHLCLFYCQYLFFRLCSLARLRFLKKSYKVFWKRMIPFYFRTAPEQIWKVVNSVSWGISVSSKVPNCNGGLNSDFQIFFQPISINNDPPIYGFFIKSQPLHFITDPPPL